MTSGIFSMGSILIVCAALAAGCKPKEDTSQPIEPTKAEQPQPAKQEPAVKPAEETKTEAPAPAAGEKKIPEGKEDLVLKLGKSTMPAVKFPHKKHATEFNVECKKCHHPEGEIEACTKCHTTKVGPNQEPTFKNAAHKACLACHKAQKKGPTACNKCHTG